MLARSFGQSLRLSGEQETLYIRATMEPVGFDRGPAPVDRILALRN